MAQSDQVAPGPGPKLTCSTPRRRAGGRALTPGGLLFAVLFFAKREALSSFSARQVPDQSIRRFNRPSIQPPKIAVQPPISIIPCKIVYFLANSVLPFLMFSSPAASPTNRSPLPCLLNSNRCHPERSEGSAFLFCLDTRHSPLFMQKVRINIIPQHLMSPLFSYSCALFCAAQNAIPNFFSNFRTLCAKHPGWGTPPHPSSPRPSKHGDSHPKGLPR